jgi:hypothetical protein
MRKVVLIATLVLVATPAFAWNGNPLNAYNPFPNQVDQDPLRGVRDAARNLNVPQYSPQTRCDSVPNGMGGWTTRCD